MNALIERLRSSVGPDREMDLAIHIAVYPESEIANLVSKHRRGFDAKPGIAWDFWSAEQIICYQNHNLGGICTSNGGIGMPRYTSSIDGAVKLVLDGWIWDVTSTGTAWVMPDDLDGELHFSAKATTPALALCIAALKARAA